MTPPTPSADLRASYLAAADEIDAAIKRVLLGGRYLLGPELQEFEHEFAGYLGVAGVVGVANGTDALELALRAVGVGAGEKVVTVANTVSATASAITSAGATPVFVEIEPDTMLMDVDAVEHLLAARRDPAIRAVVPVHLFGQAVDMPRLMEIAREYRLAVVEDCAQAHGAAVGGRKAGAWGDLAAFSFYPTKNLGALGDAGAVASSNTAMLDRVRLLSQYGWRQRFVSDLHGRNSRLDELQAAVLRVRLARLDAGNAARGELAARYLEKLRGTPLRLPGVARGRTHVWHQFVVRAPGRDELRAHLERQGILTSVHYPVPLHRQPAYRDDALTLPVTELACAEALSLPVHPGIEAGEVDAICRTIHQWAR